MRNLLNRIAEARKDALTIDVAGLDEFDITSFSAEANDAQSLLNLNIGSPTLKKAGAQARGAGSTLPAMRARRSRIAWPRKSTPPLTEWTCSGHPRD